MCKYRLQCDFTVFHYKSVCLMVVSVVLSAVVNLCNFGEDPITFYDQFLQNQEPRTKQLFTNFFLQLVSQYILRICAKISSVHSVYVDQSCCMGTRQPHCTAISLAAQPLPRW